MLQKVPEKDMLIQDDLTLHMPDIRYLADRISGATPTKIILLFLLKVVDWEEREKAETMSISAAPAVTANVAAGHAPNRVTAKSVLALVTAKRGRGPVTANGPGRVTASVASDPVLALVSVVVVTVRTAAMT